MGIDYYSCDICGCTFPDCGDFAVCVKHHHIGPCHLPFGWDDEDNRTDDGELNAELCPVCKAGGTELERLRIEVAKLRDELAVEKARPRLSAEAIETIIDAIRERWLGMSLADPDHNAVRMAALDRARAELEGLG